MDKFDWFVTGMIVGIFIVAIVIQIFGTSPGDIRKEAVEAGVAEWIVIDSDGDTEFRWITIEEFTEEIK
jgi:hypothetical protein